MCGDCRGFLGRGLVTPGRRCTGEMEVCHHLLNLLLGLLELVGELLICASQVCHRFRLVDRCLAVGGGSGGSSVGVVCVRAGGGNSIVAFAFLFREERDFEGSPRSCYSREFMPFSNG